MTEENKYPSRFDGGQLSAAQYLAENMCARKARAEGESLGPKFWQDEYWAKQYRLQIKHAHDLLKEYDIKAIIEGLKHPDANRVYSLGLKSVLIPLIKRSQRKTDNRQKVIEIQKTEPLPHVDVNQKPRQPFATKRSTLQQLRDLDNG